MSKIAWIGVGVMGGSMIKNLLKCGHEVNMYSRTPAKPKRWARKRAERCLGTMRKPFGMRSISLPW